MENSRELFGALSWPALVARVAAGIPRRALRLERRASPLNIYGVVAGPIPQSDASKNKAVLEPLSAFPSVQ